MTSFVNSTAQNMVGNIHFRFIPTKRGGETLVIDSSSSISLKGLSVPISNFVKSELVETHGETHKV